MTPAHVWRYTVSAKSSVVSFLSCCCFFFQAGLDSLGAVDLRNAVAAEFGVDLPATAAFDYPTVAALAAFVSQQAAPPDTADIVAASAHGDGQPSDAGGSSAVEAVAAGSSSGGMSREQVLASVRAAVADAIGAAIGDDEPLMEVVHELMQLPS
jgi:Phosphopantetheine attachment site